MSTTTKRLEWGRQPPEGVETAWGARAIYKFSSDPERIMVDLLWDRQGVLGKKKELKPLGAWINSVGLRALRQELALRNVTGDCSTVVTITDDTYALEACPNSSYGYLYIVGYVKA